MSSGLFRNNITYKLFCLQVIYIIYINRFWHWRIHKGWYVIKHNQKKNLQYFDNVRYNSTTLDAFVKVVKVTNYSGREIVNLSDTVWVILAGFAFVLEHGLGNYIWLLRILQPKWHFLNHLCTTNFFRYVCGIYDPVWTCEACVPKLDYVACSSMLLSNHIEWSNAQHLSTQTTMIVLTTSGTLHDLNCFSHDLHTIN